jgi:hypothetical protein
MLGISNKVSSAGGRMHLDPGTSDLGLIRNLPSEGAGACSPVPPPLRLCQASLTMVNARLVTFTSVD